MPILLSNSKFEDRELLQWLSELTPPIRTTEQFFSTRNLHDLIKELKPEVQFERLQNLFEQIALEYSSASATAQILVQKEKNARLFSTGIQQFDDILAGGVRGGQVIDFIGLPGSGKTQLCLSLISEAVSTNSKIYFFTCSASPSVRRLHHILTAKQKIWCQNYPLKNQQVEEFVLDSLSKVEVIDGLDISTVMMNLERIEDEIKTNSDSLDHMIVFDSITPMFSQLIGYTYKDKNVIGNGMLRSFGLTLKYIAVEYQVAVVITNQLVSHKSTSNKFFAKNIPSQRRNTYEEALGVVMQNCFHTQVYLYQEVLDSGIYFAKVVNSNFRTLDKQAEFSISSSGLITINTYKIQKNS